MSLLPKVMLSVYQSELGFDQTVASLTEAAKRNGWHIPMVHDLQQTYVDVGHEDMTRVKVLYFCNPDGGYRILQDDDHKPLSAMMPMGVSVYETNDSEVRIAGMNLERMSMMMGGTPKQVFGDGALQYKRTLEELERTEPLAQEVEVYKKGCVLGCLSLTAILGVLAVGLVVLMSKVMPKIMATMMPKMMAVMEDAGVQPPCAQIILERMDKEGQ